MSKCKRCDKLHILRNDYCEGCQPYQRIAELEAAAVEADRRARRIGKASITEPLRELLEGGE